MPGPEPPAEQQRRALLLLADEVAGWHAELGSPRAEECLAGALTLLAHALVDLADGVAPRPRQVEVPAAAARAGPDRAACSGLAARLRELAREVSRLVPAARAGPVTASARALAGVLQEHAQRLAAGRPAPSEVRWLAPRLAEAARPLAADAGEGPPRLRCGP